MGKRVSSFSGSKPKSKSINVHYFSASDFQKNLKNLEEKYAGKLEHKKVADNYDEIELQSQFPHQIKNSDAIDMEAQLTEQYRRPIVLKDVNDEDNSRTL